MYAGRRVGSPRLFSSSSVISQKTERCIEPPAKGDGIDIGLGVVGPERFDLTCENCR